MSWGYIVGLICIDFISILCGIKKELIKQIVRRQFITLCLKTLLKKKKTNYSSRIYRDENWLRPRAFIQISLAIVLSDGIARNSCEINTAPIRISETSKLLWII